MAEPHISRVRVALERVERLEPSERAAFIAGLRADDPWLADVLERLLDPVVDRTIGDPDRTLSLTPPGSRRSAEPVSTRPLETGAQIGPFRVVSRLGQGGFGDVYLADQDAPLRRRVALKIIKPGMDTRSVVARFEQERQALAIMDHPGIAKVFDAGATPEGRPYFAMEFVDGAPITEFCDARGLTLRQRLELFALVCDAVQHAHLKGVIHRDLKPSNILVTLRDGVPAPIVIDFGVAKAVSKTLAEQEIFSETGVMIGTPEYMSPEQADPGRTDIDTRTDVYSLGVVLYELLVGALPFESRTLRRAGYAEIQRVIREVIPPRPSTRLSELGDAAGDVARCRGTGPSDLARSLVRELEWIPLMAIRKEPERRYQSVRELADDVRRYLRGDALVAVPESAAYRLRKFVGRNRVAVGATASIVVVLSIATAVSAAMFVRATRARQVSATVTEFLVTDMLDAASADDADPMLRVRDVLDAADRAASGRFAGEPLLEEAVRERLARSFATLGDPAATLHQLDRLDALASVTGGPDLLASLEREGLRAEAVYRAGDAPAGLARMRAAIARGEALLGREHPAVVELLNQLAGELKWSGSLDEAESAYTDVLSRATRATGQTSEIALVARHNLALIPLQRAIAESDEAARRKFLEDALAKLNAVIQDATAAFGRAHRVTVGSRGEVPGLLHRLGRADEADLAYSDVLPDLDAVLGPEHWRTLDVRTNFATLRSRAGRGEEAAELYARVLPAIRARRGAGHEFTLRVVLRAAENYGRLTRAGDADRLLRESLLLANGAGMPASARDQFVQDATNLLRGTGDVARAQEWLAWASKPR